MLNGTDFDTIFVERGSFFSKAKTDKQKAKEVLGEFIDIFKKPSAIFSSF